MMNTIDRVLSRYLDTNGDGTGTNEVQGDHSVTSVAYMIMPSRGERYRILQLVCFLAGNAPLNANEFASLGAALANGLVLRTRRHSVSDEIYNLTDDEPIVANGDFNRLAHKIHRWSEASGNDYMSAVIDYRDSFGPDGLVLDGELGDALEVVARDDLSGAQIVEHRYLAQGQILSPRDVIPEGVSATSRVPKQTTLFP